MDKPRLLFKTAHLVTGSNLVSPPHAASASLRTSPAWSPSCCRRTRPTSAGRRWWSREDSQLDSNAMNFFLCTDYNKCIFFSVMSSSHLVFSEKLNFNTRYAMQRGGEGGG